MARKPSGRPKKRKQLIVVDGVTEQIYLRIIKQKIRGSSIDVKKINPCGEQAIEQGRSEGKNEGLSKQVQYNHYYIVIDKDDLKECEYSRILKDANSYEDITFIYSNEAFEVWLVAHLEKMTPGIIPRKQLNRKLTQFLNEEYDKTNEKHIRKIINATHHFIDTPKENTSSISEISYTTQCTNFGTLLDALQTV